ncbi:MAG TPA: AMP-binding protein [Caulobacteraceae bacterium]|nr:AMP-binding protein [Caulobacteraceae bacterium]
MGVKSLFARGARLFPDRLCLDDGTSRLSYAETAARVRALATALRGKGVKAGDRCALLSPNCAEAMVAILGVYEADAVFTPLNASFPAAEHHAPVRDLEVSVLFFHSRYAAAAEAILSTAEEDILTICLDDQHPMGPGLATLLAAHADEPSLDVKGHPDDLVAIYPTGGSTGPPKRAMHTRLVWETMAACYLTAIPVEAGAVFLMAPPITHAAGTYAMMMLPVGATILIHDGFDPAAVLDAIERRGVTHLFLPPTAIYKLLEQPDVRARRYASLQAFIYTAAPMSVEKLRQCLEVFGPVMVQFWGQTEAPCFLTCLAAADHAPDDPARARRLSSCGQETLFVRVGIMNDAGELVGPEETGELVVRSNLVMSGYYGNPEATAAVTRSGWHATGDVGFKDADGYVYIVGRRSDVIITGGFNVYPADVEQTLWGHPDVEECAVIGVPDDYWGETILAYVQLKPGRSVRPEALIAHCRAKLGGSRTPKRLEIIADMPRNGVGKVDKQALRALNKA